MSTLKDSAKNIVTIGHTRVNPGHVTLDGRPLDIWVYLTPFAFKWKLWALRSSPEAPKRLIFKLYAKRTHRN